MPPPWHARRPRRPALGCVLQYRGSESTYESRDGYAWILARGAGAGFALTGDDDPRLIDVPRAESILFTGSDRADP